MWTSTIQDCSFQAMRRQVCLHRFVDAIASMHTRGTACLAPVVAEEKWALIRKLMRNTSSNSKTNYACFDADFLSPEQTLSVHPLRWVHRPQTWRLETIALKYIELFTALSVDHRPKISKQFVSLRPHHPTLWSGVASWFESNESSQSRNSIPASFQGRC